MSPELAFYIANGISIITGIIAIILMQQKKMITILFLQIVVNLLGAINYFLLGGGSGAAGSALAIVQSVVMFVYTRKNKRPSVPVVVLFIISYVSVSTYNVIATRDLMEIFPGIAAVCFSVSLLQEKSSVFRIWGVLNSAFWLPYDIYFKSYVMLCVHFGLLVSAIVAMIRLDGLFQRKIAK